MIAKQKDTMKKDLWRNGIKYWIHWEFLTTSNTLQLWTIQQQWNVLHLCLNFSGRWRIKNFQEFDFRNWMSLLCVSEFRSWTFPAAIGYFHPEWHQKQLLLFINIYPYNLCFFFSKRVLPLQFHDGIRRPTYLRVSGVSPLDRISFRRDFDSIRFDRSDRQNSMEIANDGNRRMRFPWHLNVSLLYVLIQVLNIYLTSIRPFIVTLR